MKKEEFGQLLATLREDLGLTQKELGEHSGINWTVISQIERGVKRSFDSQLLFELANALELTTLERREFFLASSGLDNTQIVRQPAIGVSTDTHNAEKTLEYLVALTGQILLPALLVDVYSDIVAANYIMFGLFRVSTDYVESAANTPGGFNTIRINFSRELVSRNLITEGWHEYALTSIRTFRENSFRYRTRPYFQYLMNAFRNKDEYPLFTRYWNMVSSTEQDKELDADYFSYHHSDLGDLKFIASPTISETYYGELFLYYYIPCDERTKQVFDELKNKAGAGVVPLSPWPNKQYPTKK